MVAGDRRQGHVNMHAAWGEGRDWCGFGVFLWASYPCTRTHIFPVSQPPSHAPPLTTIPIWQSRPRRHEHGSPSVPLARRLRRRLALKRRLAFRRRLALRRRQALRRRRAPRLRRRLRRRQRREGPRPGPFCGPPPPPLRRRQQREGLRPGTFCGPPPPHVRQTRWPRRKNFLPSFSMLLLRPEKTLAGLLEAPRRPGFGPVQGLLEIKGTHRPRTLR